MRLACVARSALLALGPAAMLVSSACSATTASSTTATELPEPSSSRVVGASRTDPEAIALGRQIFEGVCTGYCHSPDVGQDRDVPDLFDCEWLHGDQDEDLFRVIMAGVAGTQMQGFNGRLPEQDVWHVVAYIRSRSRCREGE